MVIRLVEMAHDGPSYQVLIHRFNKLTKEDIVIEAGWKTELQASAQDH